MTSLIGIGELPFITGNEDAIDTGHLGQKSFRSSLNVTGAKHVFPRLANADIRTENGHDCEDNYRMGGGP
jgi:hypothetical protein